MQFTSLLYASSLYSRLTVRPLSHMRKISVRLPFTSTLCTRKKQKTKKNHCQPVPKQIRSSASSSNSVTFDLWRSRSNNQEQRCVNGCRTSNGLQTSKLSSVFVQLPGISSLKQETLDDLDDVIITSSFYIFTSITLLADKRPQRST